MREIPDFKIGRVTKNIAGVVKQCTAKTIERKPSQQNPIFEIYNHHQIAAAKTHLVVVITTQRRRTAGKVSFSDKHHTCSPKRLHPPYSNRLHYDTKSL